MDSAPENQPALHATISAREIQHHGHRGMTAIVEDISRLAGPAPKTRYRLAA